MSFVDMPPSQRDLVVVGEAYKNGVIYEDAHKERGSVASSLSRWQLQKKRLDGRTDATWANSRQIKASPKCVESDG